MTWTLPEIATALGVPEEALRPFARRVRAGLDAADAPSALPLGVTPFGPTDMPVLVLAWHRRTAGTSDALAAPLAAAADAFLAAVLAAMQPAPEPAPEPPAEPEPAQEPPAP